MNAKPPLYDEVHQLVLDIVNSSAIDDHMMVWSTYQRLENLCIACEDKGMSHPFQWETLADFTTDNHAALKIYDKALVLAQRLDTSEYVASIKLAMAERYSELCEHNTALKFAHGADEAAQNISDLELRREISEFLLNEAKYI